MHGAILRDPPLLEPGYLSRCFLGLRGASARGVEGERGGGPQARFVWSRVLGSSGGGCPDVWFLEAARTQAAHLEMDFAMNLPGCEQPSEKSLE